MTEQPGQPRIVIIGSGISGLLMAMRLKESGYTHFQICEKHGDVGGVWRDNRYPGLRCDIPAHLFTYRGESNPDYSARFARGAEVRAYLQRTAKKYRLGDNIRFHTSINAAHFDQGRWFLTTDRGEVLVADIVVWAGGVLHQENLPDIAGREDFVGDAFHSSKWDETVDLRGRRVGIIGTGSTAAQIVPAIADTVEHLTLFQRTPHWVLPLPNRNYSKRSRARLENHPWMAKLFRWGYQTLLQQTFTRATMGNRLMQRAIRWQCERNSGSATFALR